MPTNIIDLDELLGADKQVRLGGKLYKLPPDLPVELFLKINRFAATDATDAEMVDQLYQELLNLFRYKDPKLTELPVSMAQLVGAIGKIYGETQDDEPVPRPPRTRGGASSKKPRRTS